MGSDPDLAPLEHPCDSRARGRPNLPTRRPPTGVGRGRRPLVPRADPLLAPAVRRLGRRRQLAHRARAAAVPGRPRGPAPTRQRTGPERRGRPGHGSTVARQLTPDAIPLSRYVGGQNTPDKYPSMLLTNARLGTFVIRGTNSNHGPTEYLHVPFGPLLMAAATTRRAPALVRSFRGHSGRPRRTLRRRWRPPWHAPRGPPTEHRSLPSEVKHSVKSPLNGRLLVQVTVDVNIALAFAASASHVSSYAEIVSILGVGWLTVLTRGLTSR